MKKMMTDVGQNEDDLGLVHAQCGQEKGMGSMEQTENTKKMHCGTFYGIGLGPGDPELLTLKGWKTLQRVKVLYTASGRQTGRSVSAMIAGSLPDVTAEIVELEFTMSGDWPERLARIGEHADRIAERLEAGDDCAFGTIGDPMTYSTCSYLLDALKQRIPHLQVEIIPGINSWSALAAAAQRPLAEDDSELRVIPCFASGGQAPDWTANACHVLLKTYRTRNSLLAKLPEDMEFLYGENIGLAEEYISSDRTEILKRPDAYLSQLLVRKGGRQ